MVWICTCYRITLWQASATSWRDSAWSSHCILQGFSISEHRDTNVGVTFNQGGQCLRLYSFVPSRHKSVPVHSVRRKFLKMSFLRCHNLFHSLFFKPLHLASRVAVWGTNLQWQCWYWSCLFFKYVFNMLDLGYHLARIAYTNKRY